MIIEETEGSDKTMGHNKENDIKRFIAWIISLFFICVLIYVVATMIFYKPPNPRNPTLSVDAIWSGDITVRINKCHDPENMLRLKDVEVILRNADNLTFRYTVSDILINIDNNLIPDLNDNDIYFIDNDNDSKLSMGDFFEINEDIIEPRSSFIGVYKPYGSTVFSITLV